MGYKEAREVWNEARRRFPPSRDPRCLILSAASARRGAAGPAPILYHIEGISYNNVLSNTDIYHARDGIQTRTSSLVISSNRIQQCFYQAIHCIYASPRIEYNMIASIGFDGSHGENGITAEGCSSVIVGNDISNNEYAVGIYAVLGGFAEITGNTISNNLGGILCGGTDPIVTENNFVGNETYAVAYGGILSQNYLANNNGVSGTDATSGTGDPAGQYYEVTSRTNPSSSPF